MFFQSKSEAKRIQTQWRAIVDAPIKFGTSDDALFRSYVSVEKEDLTAEPSFLALTQLAAHTGSLTPMLDASGRASIWKRLNELAPELAVDLEWKVETLLHIGEKTLAFMDELRMRNPQIQAAQARGDEETVKALVHLLVDKAVETINFTMSIYSDRKSAFGRHVYDRYQHALGPLGVERRRYLQAFYAQMEITQAVYERVLEREVRAAIAREVFEITDLFRWVGELHRATLDAVGRAKDLLES